MSKIFLILELNAMKAIQPAITKLELSRELWKRYQDTKWGMGAEDQRTLREGIFRTAEENGIDEKLIYADDEEVFNLFAKKLIKQSI